MVVNAATAEKDLAWIREHASGLDADIRPRQDLAMIAVQGPNARAKAIERIPGALQQGTMALKPFFAAGQDDWLVARTGYTGEDGLEIICPANEVPPLWRGLRDADVAPCGLGARDTLRLEAGLNLYGQDMDEDTSPLESGLGWTIAWEPSARDFIGRQALETQRERGGLRRFVGLLLTGAGVLRSHQKVLGRGELLGEVTSGGFAPTLQRSGNPLDGLLAGVRPLDRDHRQVPSGPDIGIQARGMLPDPGQILLGRSGIDHHSVPARGLQIDDQVVDYAATLVEHATVQRLPGDIEPRDVICDQTTKESRRLSSLDIDNPHMGNIEHTRIPAYPVVLFELGAVVQRHVPAAEGHDPGAHRLVLPKQRGL
jgi:hypothetical protein